MEALEVEKSIAEEEPALQGLIKSAREHAGKLEAHEAEKGIFKRLLPIGLAAMQLSFTERGPGDVRPALSSTFALLSDSPLQRYPCVAPALARLLGCGGKGRQDRFLE
jgi:hypothetical protein